MGFPCLIYEQYIVRVHLKITFVGARDLTGQEQQTKTSIAKHQTTIATLGSLAAYAVCETEVGTNKTQISASLTVLLPD